MNFNDYGYNNGYNNCNCNNDKRNNYNSNLVGVYNEGIDVNGYGSCSCPRCGSTDVCHGSTNYCNKCGNCWS